MEALLTVVNLVACLLIWATAMYYYLRHDAPVGAGQHYRQIALLLVAVGAFAGAVSGVKVAPPTWSDVALRVGVAMIAAATLREAWRARSAS